MARASLRRNPCSSRASGRSDRVAKSFFDTAARRQSQDGRVVISQPGTLIRRRSLGKDLEESVIFFVRRWKQPSFQIRIEKRWVVAHDLQPLATVLV